MCVTGGVNLTEWNYNEGNVIDGEQVLFFLVWSFVHGEIIVKTRNCLLLIEDDPFFVC